MDKRKKEKPAKQKGGEEFEIGGGSCLICEYVIANSGEQMVKQFFGEVCQALSRCYGVRCHKICRLFEMDYIRLRQSFNPTAANVIREMDEQMILLGDDREDAILFNARSQAQILEIDSPYNAHWTRVNLGLGKSHKIKPEELAANFFKHEAPLDFPERWKVMSKEIRYKDDNRHYAWEKFHEKREGAIPTLKELFWTYRFGRAIEYFGRQHPDLFRAGHLVTA